MAFQLSAIDVSRLCKRRDASPTGIDRVQKAYVRWLNETQAPPLHIVHSSSGVCHLNKTSVDDILEGESLSSPEKERLGKKWRTIAKSQNRKKLFKQIESHTLSLDELNYDQLVDLTACAYPPQFKTCQKLAKKLSDDPRVYFNVCHNALNNNAYLEFLHSFKKLRKVFFIHDTIPLDFPEYCRDVERAKHKLRLIHASRYGDHLIVNSQYTKERLEFWGESFGLRPLPISIIPIGVEKHLCSNSCNGPKQIRPYFVILGTIEPRKNHLLLLEIWKSMMQSLPADEIPILKIIGRRGWEIDHLTNVLDRRRDLRQHIEEYNHLDDTELIKILGNSQGLLFPSHVEGWGMPLVEALSMSIPAICSDVPALREAGQNIPEYISPIDGKAWMEAILDYSKKNSVRREAQMKRIEHFTPPTWENHFHELDLLVSKLLQQ